MIKKENSLGKIKVFSTQINILPDVENQKFESKLLYEEKSSVFFSGGFRTDGLFKSSHLNQPLISIIMPNFKSNTLKKAINSILDQEYENIELIIIDGNSGQETIDILNNFTNDIDYWISENDNGLWDAWNKGFKLARGDFIGIVDSTNLLIKDSLSIIKNYINQNKKIDFICGTIKKDNKIYAGYRKHDIKTAFNIIPSSIGGFFINLKSLKKVGLMNIEYKIQSDYDLLYRFIVNHKMNGLPTKGDELIADLGNSGISIENKYYYKLFNELKIRYNNKQNIFILIYIFFKRIVSKFVFDLRKFFKV